MGRKSSTKERKQITKKVKLWLSQLLIDLQYENLEALTMDDMARIAGKSKSTIYEYFKSKEEILTAVCQTRINTLMASILQLSESDLEGTDYYSQLIEIFAEGTTGISITFLQSIKQYYPKAWKTIDDFTDQYVGLLQIHYREGIQKGVYNSVSVELIGSLDKLFIIQVVTNPAIFTDEKYKISDLIRDYLNLRLIGLLKR